MRKESAIILVCLILLIVPVFYFVATITDIIGTFLTVPNTNLSIDSDGNLVVKWGGVGGAGYGIYVIGSPFVLVTMFLSTLAFILLLALFFIERKEKHKQQTSNVAPPP